MTNPRDSNNATWCQKWLSRSEQQMASVPLQPPAKFNFSNPDEWPKWRRRFEQFRIASGMAGESEERQISTLLYYLVRKQKTSSHLQTSAKPTEEGTRKSSARWTSSSRSGRTLSSNEQGSTGEHSARERPPKSSSLASTAWQPIASMGTSERR